MNPTYEVRVHRLDTALADLRITFGELPTDVEVRGRLMGPRCPGVSTIEIAYHLRSLGGGVWQVLIPDPSPWMPERPHVYEGPAEFYREGVKVGSVRIAVSLKDPSAG